LIEFPAVLDCFSMPKGSQALVFTYEGFSVYDWGDSTASSPIAKLKWQKKAEFTIGGAVSQDARQIAVLSDDGVITIWNYDGSTPPEHSMQSSRFDIFGALDFWSTSTGFLLLERLPSGTLRILDVARPSKPRIISLNYDASVDSTGRIGVTISEGRLRLFDLTSDSDIASVKLPQPYVQNTPVFNPTGQYVGYETSQGFAVRKIDQLDKVDWSVEVPDKGSSRLDLDATGKIARFGSRIYRRDKTAPDPGKPWAEFVRALRAYTTICLSADARRRLFAESTEEAAAKTKSCESNQGRSRPPARVSPNEPAKRP